MFSNLQNKIDLRKIRDNAIESDSEFIFQEDFDIVNQTLNYFQEKKHTVNNIVIREEVIEYENGDIFDFIEKSVEAEQEFIYNNKDTLDTIKDVEEDKKEVIHESFSRYHKEQKLLPRILKEANEEAKTHLDAYRMVDNEDNVKTGDTQDNNEYDASSIFDSNLLDMAKKEQLDNIYTMNWLEKQLVAYRKSMNDDLLKGGNFQIDNGLKSLDVNDTEEIKNKIKDLQESVRFLNSKANNIVKEEFISVGISIVLMYSILSLLVNALAFIGPSAKARIKKFMGELHGKDSKISISTMEKIVNKNGTKQEKEDFKKVAMDIKQLISVGKIRLAITNDKDEVINDKVYNITGFINKDKKTKMSEFDEAKIEKFTSLIQKMYEIYRPVSDRLTGVKNENEESENKMSLSKDKDNHIIKAV
jgi:hypothetical protein